MNGFFKHCKDKKFTLPVLAGWVIVFAMIWSCGGGGGDYIDPWHITSESPVIKEIKVSAPLNKIGVGDLWFSTWADDDSLFMSWGDGYGPVSYTYVHHGLAKANGSLPNISMEAVNMQMPLSDDVANSKPSGLLFYQGRLYVSIHSPLIYPAFGFIAYSDDYGRNFQYDTPSSPWTQGNNSKFICLMFINMGKDYQLNTDGYVYAFGIGSECFWNGSVYLARVPKDRIIEYGAWTYFVALDKEGSPTWSTRQSDARPLSNLESTWQLSSMYHSGTGRYIIMTGNQTYGKFYDAPNPWGPWTLVSYWYNPVMNSDAYSLCYMPGLITKDAGKDYFYFTAAGMDWDNTPFPHPKYTLTLARIDMILR